MIRVATPDRVRKRSHRFEGRYVARTAQDSGEAILTRHRTRNTRSNMLAVAGALLICAEAAAGSQSLAGQGRESLGQVDFPVSCAPSVQAEFNRGLALLHHMTYPLAFSAFERVTELDPECAMGHWGMAMTLFQPLWPTRPGDAELRRGWEAAQEAGRSGAVTERERLYVAAVGAFFDPSGSPDYWQRIDRWAEATTAVYEAYPEDLDAAALFALAQLATSSRSGAPIEHQERAAEVLLAVHQQEPTHPGAVHYTIHANDFTGRERESLAIVRSYGEIAPANPHALHMPTHIFVRLGDWPDVITWNKRAASAALAQRAGENGEYVWDEYPHAVEYLAYAYLQRGDDVAAADIIQALHATPDIQPGFKTAFHLASTAARYVLERQAWAEAEALPLRSPGSVDWDRFPWPEAVTWFARGLGASRNGEVDEARRSIERLAALQDRASSLGEAPFAREIEILRVELSAWLAQSTGDSGRAVQIMEEAVALQGATPKNPVTPAATIPASELLGDLLTEIGDARGALEAYRASDEMTPGRFNSLLGAARSADEVGATELAREYYRRLLEIVVPESPRRGAAEARAYLAGSE